ncbi:MAG: hypothetical protein ABW044_12655, partial [Cellvibrio sp.]
QGELIAFNRTKSLSNRVGFCQPYFFSGFIGFYLSLSLTMVGDLFTMRHPLFQVGSSAFY